MGLFRGIRNAGLPDEVKADRYERRQQSKDYERESIGRVWESTAGRVLYVILGLVLAVSLVYAMVK